MRRDEQLRVVHAVDGDALFLVLNKIEIGVGNAVMVVCLGPKSMENEYTYKVKAKNQIKGCLVQRKYSSIGNMSRSEGTFPPNDSFLLISKNFGGSDHLDLDITVYTKVETECKSTVSHKGTTPTSDSLIAARGNLVVGSPAPPKEGEEPKSPARRSLDHENEMVVSRMGVYIAILYLLLLNI